MEKPYINKTSNYELIDESILKYAAGLTDSDGMIGTNTDNNYNSISIYVKIGQAEKGIECLNYMHNHFGGIINFHKEKTDKHQSSYNWLLFGIDAVKYCKILYPYIILKKKQFQIGSEFPYDNIKIIKLIACKNGEELFFKTLKDCNKYFNSKIHFRNSDNITFDNWNIKPYLSHIDIENIKLKRLLIKEELKLLKSMVHDDIQNNINPGPEYIAGICDGDACFDTHGKTSQHHCVTQKYRPICDLLLRLYGGSVYYRKGSNTWAWEIYSLAEVFLEKIAPYIIGKKKQVDLIMNMKPGEALKIHAELRLLKGNYTASTPLIDKINNNENVTNYKNKAKTLPKGVHLNKNGDRFKALIKHKKIQYDLGTYDTIEEAKNIYNKYKKEIFEERNGGPIVNLSFNKRYK
jgi:hypothetical protein